MALSLWASGTTEQGGTTPMSRILGTLTQSIPARPVVGGAFASVVAPAFGVEADLGGCGDVEHVVHLPVPGAGEAVSDLLAGRGIQRCGAGPRGEPVAIGELNHVAGIGQDPCGDHRADAGQVHQPRPVRKHERL